MAVTIQQYQTSYKLSQFYLDLLGIDYFPLDLDKIIEKINAISEFKILVATQQEYLEFRIANGETGNEIRIKDGRTYYVESDKLYLIVYNDSKPIKRIRFTIAHELGHILLGHLENEITEINRGGISNELYQELENQADVFAGNFLVPPILLNERLKMVNSRVTPYIISETFQISEPAVYNRYKDLDAWRTQAVINSVEKNILNRCKDSVCIVACSACGAETVISNPEKFFENKLFCKYCGCENFSYIRRKYSMQFEGIETNDEFKALVCPVCKNEHIVIDGDFCEICGTKLINECAETPDYENDSYIAPCKKGEKLDGFARFCPYCGNQSSFLQNGILRPVIRNNKTFNISSQWFGVSNSSSADLLELSKDDLPF